MQAIEYYEQAIEKDPDYALAYTGLAFTYRLLSSDYLHPREVMPRAKEAALKALELDEALSEAHASLGVIELLYEWDWPVAEKEFKWAIELNPSSADAHLWYGLYLTAMGRHDEAIAETRQALNLDPFSLYVQSWSLWTGYLTRRYDLTIEQARKTVTIDPNFGWGHAYLGLALAAKGEYDEAVRELRTAVGLADSPLIPLFLAYVYAISGQRAEAEKIVEDVKNITDRYVCPYEVAAVYVGLGEDDLAFEWFQQAMRDRSDCIPFLAVDPRFDHIRSDPRFVALVEQAGLASQ